MVHVQVFYGEERIAELLYVGNNFHFEDFVPFFMKLSPKLSFEESEAEGIHGCYIELRENGLLVYPQNIVLTFLANIEIQKYHIKLPSNWDLIY